MDCSNEKLGYVCAVDRKLCMVLFILSGMHGLYFLIADNCGEGWIKRKSSCYKYIGAKATDFDSGQSYCRVEQAQLFVPNSKSESEFLSQIVSAITVL